jgi:hypothetical protein
MMEFPIADFRFATIFQNRQATIGTWELFWSAPPFLKIHCFALFLAALWLNWSIDLLLLVEGREAKAARQERTG